MGGLEGNAVKTGSPGPVWNGAAPQRPTVPGPQGAHSDRGLEIRENGGPVGGAGSLLRTRLSFVSLLNRENTGNFLEICSISPRLELNQLVISVH